MEISPIPGIRIAPAIRSKEADLGLTDVYEVERSTRTGDETYTPSGARAASGYEDDEDKYDDSEDAEAESKVQSAEDSQISRFA